MRENILNMHITLLQNARHEDLEKIYQLSIELVERYEDLATVNYDYIQKWIKEKIETKMKDYYCIYHEDLKVGYLLLSEVDGEIEIDDFYLFEEYRGKGIGTAVLKKILKNDQNYFLYVFKENEIAIHLYKVFGFKIAQEVGKTRLVMRCQKSV